MKTVGERFDTNKVQATAEKLAHNSVAGVERGAALARDGLDRATTAVGQSVASAGEAFESAGKNAGRSLVSAGEYLQHADPSTMGHDIVEVMRKHPGATLGAGVAAGILLSRLFSSRH